MRIGLDFDNTIVCYDQAIAQLAEELFKLPENVPRTKLGLRDYLRSAGREPDWTAFQGALYGPGMQLAEPYEGCLEALSKLSAQFDLFIVSHRSKSPYAGPNYDLHQSAVTWIHQNLTYQRDSDNRQYPLAPVLNTSFHEEKYLKIQQICDLNLDIFLDDLPSILLHPSFPVSTKPILFDPNRLHTDLHSMLCHVQSWHHFLEVVMSYV
jgi:hypothetical protein